MTMYCAHFDDEETVENTMIHNPYLKKGSLKRDRPWQDNNVPTCVISAKENQVEAQKKPTTEKQTSNSNDIDKNQLDESLPDDFDWETAIKIADSSTKDTKTAESCPQPITLKPPPPPEAKSSAPKPPLIVQRPMKTVTEALRPESWNNMKPSPSRPGVSNASNVAGMAPTVQLPRELDFKPETVKPVSDQYRQELVRNAEISKPLLNGWDLYAHQKRAILRAIQMRRMILALDMGLGKTLIGCSWARSFYKTFDCKTIVICPVSLKAEWKRTAEKCTGLQVQKDEKKCDDTTKDLFIGSWKQVPKQVTGKYILIVDEAHGMQSMQAERTKEILNLVKPSRCVGVLLLTGTPMKNGKPSNLFPLLRAVNHPFGKNQRVYEAFFCGGRECNFGRGTTWVATGASNLDLLREKVSSHLLFLRKEDCLKDLPPQTRVVHKVSVSSRQQLQHDKALQDLASVYNSGNSMGTDEAVLGAVQKVRMVGSLAKVDASVALAKDILNKEPAVVIFTSFQEVARRVHEKLEELGWKGELYTGKTKPEKRQAMVDNFQQGLSSVFVCTFGTAGVGLTLTAAHTIILLDRPWTPGETFQAEDRVRRIGQTKPVTSIWMSAFEIDRQVDAIIESKKQTSAAVLAETEGVETKEAKLSIKELLKRILPSKSSCAAQADGMTQLTMDQFSQR